MALNHRKDEKIQLYRKVTKTESETSTREYNYRQFIYSQDKFESGGLFANARMLTNTEATSGGLQFDKQNVKFIVNRNDDITTDLKVIYRGKIYDINSIDALDFRSKEMSFTAILTSDTTPYEGDLFNE